MLFSVMNNGEGIIHVIIIVVLQCMLRCVSVILLKIMQITPYILYYAVILHSHIDAQVAAFLSSLLQDNGLAPVSNMVSSKELAHSHTLMVILAWNLGAVPEAQTKVPCATT